MRRWDGRVRGGWERDQEEGIEGMIAPAKKIEDTTKLIEMK